MFSQFFFVKFDYVDIVVSDNGNNKFDDLAKQNVQIIATILWCEKSNRA